MTNLGLPSREQINAQADLNLWGNWQVFAAGQRDLANSQFLNTEYGLGYEDECLAISLAYRRKYTEDLILGVPPSTSVILRFSAEDRRPGRSSPSACSRSDVLLTRPDQSRFRAFLMTPPAFAGRRASTATFLGRWRQGEAGRVFP